MPESVWLDHDDLQNRWILASAERRRLKALLVLGMVWGSVFLLHWLTINTPWGGVMVPWMGAMVLLVHCGRALMTTPDPVPSPWVEADLPRVSVLIPAKNERKVVPRLLKSLAELDYPASHLDIWAIDDASTDDTAAVLARIQAEMPHLHIYSRPPGSTGGKSGALNEVLPLTAGEIILVCDADAVVPPDLLRRALPLFRQSGSRLVGAVQVRKAISNADHNFWTQGQRLEMACDSYLQQQRVAIDGIGELRGNGQLVRRDVLAKCGGWNEATLTDDLDLTFKLHLAGVDIAFLAEVPILEEGVTSWKALWHQRSRWAEGGFQRYLDYGPGIAQIGFGNSKRIDLLVFFVSQYLLPMTMLPDLFWSVFYSHRPLLLPMTAVVVAISWISIARGMSQFHGLRRSQLLLESLRGLLYMLHWIPVMIFTTTRMCIQPKRLKWVKTVHGS